MDGMDGQMDEWTDGTVKLSVRPFYPADRPLCDGRNGRTDPDGDGNCPSVHQNWTDPCLFCPFYGRNGWTVFDGDTPLDSGTQSLPMEPGLAAGLTRLPHCMMQQRSTFAAWSPVHYHITQASSNMGVDA